MNRKVIRAGTIAYRISEDEFYKSHEFEREIECETDEISEHEETLLRGFAFRAAAKMQQEKTGKEYDDIILNVFQNQVNRETEEQE